MRPQNFNFSKFFSNTKSTPKNIVFSSTKWAMLKPKKKPKKGTQIYISWVTENNNIDMMPSPEALYITDEFSVMHDNIRSNPPPPSRSSPNSPPLS